MSWIYRIIEYSAGGYGLHGAFCDADGKVEFVTRNAANFMTDVNDTDPVEAIVGDMEQAIKDARRLPILPEEEIPDEEA